MPSRWGPCEPLGTYTFHDFRESRARELRKRSEDDFHHFSEESPATFAEKVCTAAPPPPNKSEGATAVKMRAKTIQLAILTALAVFAAQPAGW